MTTPTLRTARLVLRPYVRADEEEFVALFQDTRVTRWIGDGPQPEAKDRALFQRVFEVYAADEFEVWAVCEEGRLVGHAELKPTKLSGGHEIVYLFAHDRWGYGLGTEVAGAVLGYGFGTLGLPRVHATVAAPNAASLTLLTRLGFRHVRDLPEPAGTPTTRLLTLERPDPAP